MPLYANAALFMQDFSSSADVSSYVSPNPSEGQWNKLESTGGGVTVAINEGALQFSRNGNNTGLFVRTADFTPEPAAIIYSFTLLVSATADYTTAAQFYVGSFDTAAGVETANSWVHSKIGVNFVQGGGFQIRDVSHAANSATYSGAQTITWVVNNSGGSISYAAPNGTVATVADDRWDLWIGNDRALSDRQAVTSDQHLTDLKLVFDTGVGTLRLDNFSVTAVPEFSLTPVVGALFFAGMACWIALRASRRSQ